MTDRPHPAQLRGDSHDQDREHEHEHDHPGGRLRRILAAVVGHSHDPRDSLDDALTGDARGFEIAPAQCHFDRAMQRRYDVMNLASPAFSLA